MINSTCATGGTLKELLEAINAVPSGTAFIVDEENKLEGIYTDGDFRRLLLSGRSLNSVFTKEDLSEFVFAFKGQDIQKIIASTDRKVRIIPIVNDKMELVDFVRFEHKMKYTPIAEPALSSKELEYLTDAFLSTWISSSGKYINKFEADFSSYSECEFGVATSNGTVAIHLALEALGIGEGDEVIVPDLTFAATINAVLHANATPVVVDVDPIRWTIDPAEIEKAITSKTKGIIPVHIYGQPCEMDKIMQIAKTHNLSVIEDCAEAHGATFKGRKIGSFGDVATFSFFGNKIITTGEGGMCTTNSEELNKKMRVLRDHGMDPNRRYWHDVVGYNYRMTNLQAAIGCAQLERIDEIISNRYTIESKYKEALKGIEWVQWQTNFNDSEKVVWLVSAVLDGKNREDVFEALSNERIDVRPFFYPLSDMDIYKSYVFSCKVSKALSVVGFNLPTVEDVDFDQMKRAFEAVK
ncbi:MAG: perosamine synthetase [Parvicellaceae bacterium]|jgi:perosamine synthetase